MKPKEFDELLRQKFDQNDFEYNPGNWEKLAEELDGRAKKRSVIMWWWVPLAGVAASVALAMAVPGFMRQDGQLRSTARVSIAPQNTLIQQLPAQEQPAIALAVPATAAEPGPAKKGYKKQKKAAVIHSSKTTADYVAIRFHDGADRKTNSTVSGINLLATGNMQDKNKDKKKQVVVNDGYNTFKPEVTEERKAPKLSIILSGGINRGNMNNGFIAGATIRRMVNDRVYVEGDIAFANTNNTQVMAVPTMEQGTVSAKNAKATGSGKTSSPDAGKVTPTSEPVVVTRDANVTYNLSYAQVTPSIGYKLMKKMSVAAGPDFQEMLVDNRPAASPDARGNVQEVPVFDVGLMGKSEYSVTRNIKAAVAYRKGVNSLISMNGKYIDRDYLQFQVKCAIFNK